MHFSTVEAAQVKINNNSLYSKNRITVKKFYKMKLIL